MSGWRRCSVFLLTSPVDSSRSVEKSIFAADSGAWPWVRGVVLEHGEFKAYGDRVRRVFDGWRQEHAPRLRELAVADSPKDLIRDLSEDLLHRFAGLPLLDRYGVYQCLMDYWDEVMQDDVYLVVTEGWTEAARPRVLVPVKGKGTAEPPDLTVNRKKYGWTWCLPGLWSPGILPEQAEVDRLRMDEEALLRAGGVRRGVLRRATGRRDV